MRPWCAQTDGCGKRLPLTPPLLPESTPNLPSSGLQVFKALTALAKENPTSEDAFKPVEQMINEAFEEIDKATGVPVAMPMLGVSKGMNR